MRETIGQPLFPVRIRVSQGHNKKLVKDADADLLLATRFYSDSTACWKPLRRRTKAASKV